MGAAGCRCLSDDAASDAGAAEHAPGPRLMTSLGVTGAGLAIAFVSVVAIVIPLLGTFTSSTYSVPGDLRLHLHHARYTVYQHTGSRSPFGSNSNDASVIRLDPSMLAVRGIDGTVVRVAFDANSETITRGSNVYQGTLEFDVPSGGEYDLTFTNATPTTVVVARSITDALRSVLAWFAIGAIGGRGRDRRRHHADRGRHPPRTRPARDVPALGPAARFGASLAGPVPAAVGTAAVAAAAARPVPAAVGTAAVAAAAARPVPAAVGPAAVAARPVPAAVGTAAVVSAAGLSRALPRRSRS